MSDAWLIGRARELIATVQRSKRNEQLDIAETLDDMLVETQRRGEPTLVAHMLRSTALARLVTSDRAIEAEPTLDEMLAHSRRHGLTLFRADAHALRGRRLVLAAQEDAALTEIARALAILDDSPRSEAWQRKRSTDKLLASTLIDCWLVLNQLGVYEAAEEIIARAHQAIRDSAGPHEITLQLLNRVKMLLGWGLRLERVDRDDDAADKFRTAAEMAIAVEAPFAESLFPRKPGIPASDQVGVLAAAPALATPDGIHIERLRRLTNETGYPHERGFTLIALARCLHTADRTDEAIQLLTMGRAELASDNSQPAMRLNLIRELAKLSNSTDYRSRREMGEGEIAVTNPLIDYASTLESELWLLRESQIATLNTRRAHERLSAEHGAITQQAMQDPLTGLPNRRALDDQLRGLASSATAHPLAVALVDLDGFKDVNDMNSHAAGDDVLRVVASTLRDALRGDDIVARYGGDEFIALLPGAPVSSATQALGRAVSAVSSLPHHLSHGVTLSVGLVSLRPQERAEQVLARADAAMYQAKRKGGNQVASTTPTAESPMLTFPNETDHNDPTSSQGGYT